MSPISLNQKRYLQKQKREKYLVIFLRFFILTAFLLLWEVSARTGWIDSFIFSSPSLVMTTFFDMLKNQDLMFHISVTLKETLISFLFVIILSLGLAILLWISPRCSKVLEPYLVVLNSLPKSALAPLLIVWLGASTRTIIVAGGSVAIFGSVLNLYTGFKETDPDKLKLIDTLGGSKKDELFKVVLPGSIPQILSIMKVNIGLCLVGIIIGEFISSKSGLGFLIIYGSQVFLCAGIRNTQKSARCLRSLDSPDSRHFDHVRILRLIHLLFAVPELPVPVP